MSEGIVVAIESVRGFGLLSAKQLTAYSDRSPEAGPLEARKGLLGNLLRLIACSGHLQARNTAGELVWAVCDGDGECWNLVPSAGSFLIEYSFYTLRRDRLWQRCWFAFPERYLRTASSSDRGDLRPAYHELH